MPDYKNKQNIDKEGYRKNVGIIICNDNRQVLWARRSRRDGWQFPQGGIELREAPKEAAFRELYEETGLCTKDVRLLGNTQQWLKYDVPFVTKTNDCENPQVFKGQKQKWFLFHLIGADERVNLYTTSRPEFDGWCWIDYWRPVVQVISFKKAVYRQALSELEPLLNQVKTNWHLS